MVVSCMSSAGVQLYEAYSAIQEESEWDSSKWETEEGDSSQEGDMEEEGEEDEDQLWV